MDEQAKRDLRNVIVFAMVDGKLGVEEKRFVESLRVRLGIGEAELRELCDEVRRDPKRLSLPRDRQEAADVVRLLVGAAAADGEISTRERQLLSRLASKAGLEESDIEEFIASDVDLIIASPKEAQPLTDPVAQAHRAGIPVIVLDRAVLGDEFTCFIGADNIMIGRAAGRWIVDRLGGSGRIVELKGLMTSMPGQDRHQGFREALEGTDIEVIFEADMKWLEPEARKEMDSALARFDDVDLVYAHNDPGAHGAWLAAKAAEREDDILFVGIDALPHEGIAYVRQGMLDATFQYPTGGAEAIDTAIRILSGEQVPKHITLGSRIFTRDNVEIGGQPIE